MAKRWLDKGLMRTSWVNLCNLFTVEKRRLRLFVGIVGPGKMGRVCRALVVATGCGRA